MISFPRTIIRRPILTPEPFLTEIDALEKIELVKTISTAENTWYKCYDWLFKQINQSVKKCESDTK